MDQAPDRELFSDFDKDVVKCLHQMKKVPSAFAAANAVNLLRRAWKLYGIDTQSAAFLAITAEEEAGRARLLHLREHQYPLARRCRTRTMS